MSSYCTRKENALPGLISTDRTNHGTVPATNVCTDPICAISYTLDDDGECVIQSCSAEHSVAAKN